MNELDGPDGGWLEDEHLRQSSRQTICVLRRQPADKHGRFPLYKIMIKIEVASPIMRYNNSHNIHSNCHSNTTPRTT